MTSPVPWTAFSTDGLSGFEAWDRWRDAVAPLYDIEEVGGPEAFRASIEAFDLRTMILSRLTSEGVEQTGRRTRQLIRRSGIDHYALEFCTSGDHLGGDSRNGSFRFQAGSIVALDLAQPMTSNAGNFDSVTLTIPREPLDRHCPGMERLHGTCIGRRGLAGLLRDHTLSLFRHLPEMNTDEADAAAGTTAALLAACLAPSGERLGQAGGVIDQTLLDRARRHIEARLFDAGLSTATICAAVGTSRSNLYRLFQPAGGVARYIQERRLRSVHAALSNPAERRGISELAYGAGFSSASHFSRAFRELFGCSPSDIRDMRRGKVVAGLERQAPQDTIKSWLTA